MRITASAAADSGSGQQLTAPPDQAAEEPTPSVQQLAAAAADASTFAAALQRLAARGSGCTEAHVVAAWAAQRRTPALHPSPSQPLAQQQAALQALVALEEVTRQQLVALTPDQLGYVFRCSCSLPRPACMHISADICCALHCLQVALCASIAPSTGAPAADALCSRVMALPSPLPCRCYVLACGATKPLLLALQQAACSWRAEDYSAAGFAELAWALASSSQPVSDGCRQLLRSALQSSSGAGSGGDAGSNLEQQHGQQHAQDHQAAQADISAVAQPEAAQQSGAAGPPPSQQQQQQQQQLQGQHRRQQRDWEAWFEGTPSSRVVLLLWAAGRLGCRPCGACTEAAAAALLRGGLDNLPCKVGG